MNRLTAHNLRAAVNASLILAVGYCFGGRIGLGIGLFIILLSQIFG